MFWLSRAALASAAMLMLEQRLPRRVALRLGPRRVARGPLRCLTGAGEERTLDARPRFPKPKGVDMHRHFSRFIVVCAGLVALCGLIAVAAAARPVPQTEPGDLLDPRT
jgi:hypothetical protein